MKRAAFVVVMLGACNRNAAPATVVEATEKAPAKEEHDEEGESHHLSVTPELEQQAHIRVETLARSSTAEGIQLMGEAAPDPDLRASVVARGAGRIVEVHFREGDLVQKNAELVVIESAELARAWAALAGAQARAQSTRHVAERLAGLVKEGLAPQQQLMAADADAASADAELRAAQAILQGMGVSPSEKPENAARLVIRAPMGGVVTSRDATLGQAVTSEHQLATVVDTSRILFLGRLAEADSVKVKRGTVVDIRFNANPLSMVSGTVDMVGSQLDPTTHTLTARIPLKNADGAVKLGMFGRAFVRGASTGRSDGGANLLRVPLTAVTRLGDRDAVFVKLPDGTYEPRPLTLGARDATHAEVIAGLHDGDSVVVDGVFSLKSLLFKSTFGEE